jgi:hypothetical protein
MLGSRALYSPGKSTGSTAIGLQTHGALGEHFGRDAVVAAVYFMNGIVAGGADSGSYAERGRREAEVRRWRPHYPDAS